MKVALQGIVFLAAWLASSVAMACPYCAGRTSSGLATGLLIASMIVLPFAVAGVVFRAIRKGGYADSDVAPTDGHPSN